MRPPVIVLVGALAGCGDNLPGAGPDLARAQSLFITAHRDDDMIFMQPELLAALADGPVTTIYVASGDPKGLDNAEKLLSGARYAYGEAVGSLDWDCGYIPVEGAAVHHCRLHDRAVSLIGLDMPDGGIEGQSKDSLLHLIEGDVKDLPILGPLGGRADVHQIIVELAAVIAATAPKQIHALDVSATHGRDHSSHLMSSSFTLWALARLGYSGPLRWHRGYNVADFAETLPDRDFVPAADMLGYYEACYFECGPCGTSCKKLDVTHEIWMRRQYFYDRVPEVGGVLAIADGGACATITPGGALALGDCASAEPMRLEPSGHLVARELCAASTPAGDVELEPCANEPAQYWLLDSEGHLWNGAPPDATSGMDYDHVRCLAPDASGARAIAPTCGADLQPVWELR